MSPLYNVLCRASSHSRNAYSGYKREVHKYNIYEQTILNTLSNINAMPFEELQEYQRKVIEKYARIRLDLAYQYKQANDFLKSYESFEDASVKLPRQYKIYYWAVFWGCDKVFETLVKFKKLFAR